MNRRHSVNDIALMQLDDPLMFSGNVRPLCMPYGKVPRAGSRDCKVAGWGVTGEIDDKVPIKDLC